MGSFYSRDKFTAEDLVVETAVVIAKTLPNVSIEETEIVLEKYDLTPQIHLETMRIDIPIAKTVSYGPQFRMQRGRCRQGQVRSDLLVRRAPGIVLWQPGLCIFWTVPRRS